ncbi:hypothetical protein, partial [Streptomyces sp. NPDC088554]|uniref:hypothetical protein n=1 Tax=Streptomyces sp. NPDC088554 TaxID=3365865 RepID=UPI003822084B
RGEDLAVRGETRGHKLRGIWPHTGSLRRPPSLRRLDDSRLLDDPPPYRRSPVLRGPRHLLIERIAT